MTDRHWKVSEGLMEEATRYIPGGVNSPVRSFRAVGGNPPFISRARGSRLYDVDGNDYIDYVLSWGPLILGHAHPEVVEAVQRAAARGTSYGAPTELEVEMARLITEVVPSVEKVRMVNSGTEAAMSALRLARGFTGRDKVVKFAGCYHGHVDSLLVRAGSGATTLGIPDSPGVTAGTTADTLILPFNDLGAVEETLGRFGREIAAVILEPVVGNMGVILPRPGFLQGLRELTREHGCLLIFDEVMTGFRVAPGGAQELYGVMPDLTCLGKVIGGGLPVGAYGGTAEIMEQVAPQGSVYQAGTLSGNPLAMAAGLATLRALLRPGVFDAIAEKTAALASGIKKAAEDAGFRFWFARAGTMFSLFCTSDEVVDYDTASRSDTRLFSEFFDLMLRSGVYMAPSQFEAGFMSAAHTCEDIELTVEAAGKAFNRLASKRRAGGGR